MKKLLTIPLLLALALAGSSAMPADEPAPQPLAELCPYQGFPGAVMTYCVDGDPTLLTKTAIIPDGRVDYEHLCALPARYGQRLALRMVWTHLQTHERQPLAAELWYFRPTEARPCERRIVTAAWPGESWMPDLTPVPMDETWLPDIGNAGSWEEEP